MLEVKPCAFGVGVFTTTPIQAGEKVCTFSGSLIDYTQSVSLGDRECDPLQVGQGQYIAWDDPARLINHSCEPNCGVNSDDRHVFAVCEIEAGQELYWDYSTSIGTDETWRLPCECGTPSCRKVVGPFAELPAELQQQYLEMGIVLSYLRP